MEFGGYCLLITVKDVDREHSSKHFFWNIEIYANIHHNSMTSSEKGRCFSALGGLNHFFEVLRDRTGWTQRLCCLLSRSSSKNHRTLTTWWLTCLCPRKAADVSFSSNKLSPSLQSSLALSVWKVHHTSASHSYPLALLSPYVSPTGLWPVIFAVVTKELYSWHDVWHNV